MLSVKILLIGPSNVGKSCYGKFTAENINNCVFHDLDALIASEHGARASKLLPLVGEDKFFQISMDTIRSVTDTDNLVILIAVGAGSLQSSNAIILPKEYTSILIYANPEEVYQRDRLKSERDFSTFYNTEFSSHRLKIYNAAQYECNVSGLSLMEAKYKFKSYINEVFLNAT